jgi:hypothetical protein
MVCNECLEVLFLEEWITPIRRNTEEIELISIARANGWTSRKYGDNWHNKCPKCKK